MFLENILCFMKVTHNKYCLVFDRRKSRPRWTRRENGSKGWGKDMTKEINDKNHNPKRKKEKKKMKRMFYQIKNRFQTKGILFTEFRIRVESYVYFGQIYR